MHDQKFMIAEDTDNNITHVCFLTLPNIPCTINGQNPTYTAKKFGHTYTFIYIVLHLLLAVFNSVVARQFIRGSRSGDCAGQAASFFSRQFLHNPGKCLGSLSCWKTNLSPISGCPEGMTCLFSKECYPSWLKMHWTQITHSSIAKASPDHLFTSMMLHIFRSFESFTIILCSNMLKTNCSFFFCSLWSTSFTDMFYCLWLIYYHSINKIFTYLFIHWYINKFIYKNNIKTWRQTLKLCTLYMVIEKVMNNHWYYFVTSL